MPYNKNIATVENSVTKEEFEAAWLLYEKNIGSLRFRWIKLVALFCLVALIVALNPTYTLSMSSYGLPLLGITVLICIVSYLLIVKVQNIAGQAEKIYQSSSILNLAETIEIRRDGFIIKNKYEELQGYWSELSKCFETKDTFIFLGVTERPLLVLSKRHLDSNQSAMLSTFFESTFASKYHKV